MGYLSNRLLAERDVLLATKRYFAIITLPMSRTLTPIDISHLPDLLRLAEEVQNTKTPRILKRDNETVAMLMPVGTPVKPEKKPSPTKADYDASLAALGSWRDLDPDALIAHVYRAREEGSRPTTRP